MDVRLRTAEQGGLRGRRSRFPLAQARASVPAWAEPCSSKGAHSLSVTENADRFCDAILLHAEVYRTGCANAVRNEVLQPGGAG